MANWQHDSVSLRLSRLFFSSSHYYTIESKFFLLLLLFNSSALTSDLSEITQEGKLVLLLFSSFFFPHESVISIVTVVGCQGEKWIDTRNLFLSPFPYLWIQWMPFQLISQTIECNNIIVCSHFANNCLRFSSNHPFIISLLPLLPPSSPPSTLNLPSLESV